MSSENVALLEDIYERWSEGDFHLSLGEDFSISMGPDFPDAGEHTGAEGVSAYMRDFLEPWERLTIEAEEMFEDSRPVRMETIMKESEAMSRLDRG
jgi:hypothetical protein